MPKTGLGAQFGYAAESSFGSRATPTRFNEIREEGIELAIERIESEGLRAGRRVTEHWVANKKGAEGAVTFEVANKGFGLLFKNILGATALSTATTGGGGVYDHAATLGDLDGLSLTLQVGRPDVGGGAANPFDYVGAKIAEAEFTNEVDGILLLSCTFDAQDEKTDQSLATASYATSLVPLTYVGGTITLAGSSVDVRDFSCAINNGLKTDRHYIRGSTLKKEQIEETQVAGREITGAMTADFEGLTQYNRFTAGDEVAIVGLWRGALITTGYYFEVELTLPRCRLEGQTPTVGGADVIEQPLPFKALQPSASASPLTIRYRTTDATP